MSRMNEALALLQAEGAVLSPVRPTSIEGFYVYMVSNGHDVLQIGHGQGARLSRVMRGGLAGKHNKAFICAAGETVLGRSNEYRFVRMPTKGEAEAAERRVHQALGIRTNAECATWISGFSGTEYVEIQEQLWERLKLTPEYRALGEIEKRMAEDLFELVTYPRDRIRRRYPIRVPAAQGDNLEGHILRSLGVPYLIVVFEKLTNRYLRYLTHRPDEATYRRMLAEYDSPSFLAIDRPRSRPAAPGGTLSNSPAAALAERPNSAVPTVFDPGTAARRLSEDPIPRETHVVNAGGDGRNIYIHRIDSRYLIQRVVLKLSWKRSEIVTHVGYFELNLNRLLAAGYVQQQANGKIRLDFHLRPGNEIWLYVNQRSPMLRLA